MCQLGVARHKAWTPEEKARFNRVTQLEELLNEPSSGKKLTQRQIEDLIEDSFKNPIFSPEETARMRAAANDRWEAQRKELSRRLCPAGPNGIRTRVSALRGRIPCEHFR